MSTTTSRVAVITGCNSGLGYGILLRVARDFPDTHVVMACRNEDKAQTAKESVIKDIFKNRPVSVNSKAEKQLISDRISFLPLDLSDPVSVYKAADTLRKR